MKGSISLYYENLKKNRAIEAKSNDKTWPKFKKHMNNRFLPSSYKQGLYLVIISLSFENLK